MPKDTRVAFAIHLHRHGYCWLTALGVGAMVVVLMALAWPAEALTATPTATATPRPTGDLGTKEITGRVYDARLGDDAGIAGANVEYRRVARFPPGESGTVVTDGDGDFAFQLFLHDTDDVHIAVSAEGFASQEISYSGYGLWIAPPLAVGLLPLSGAVEIAPTSPVSLPCEGDGEVEIINPEPPGGETLTITAILPSNSYSQGDYGTGFSWDLGDIALPLTLAPGERVAFPVHYSAAGQSFPSRLTVRLRSTARNGPGFGVPYRGDIADCGAPTPTATPLPACAGDCDGDGTVTIAELVRAVALALGRALAWCANADLDAGGTLEVNELVAAVGSATDGCAAAAAP